MAPVLNIRVFRLDESYSGTLQQNRPYFLEVGGVSLGGQGSRQGEVPDC